MMKSVFVFVAALTLSLSAQASFVKFKSEEAFRGFVESFDSSKYEEIEVVPTDLSKTEYQAILKHAKESANVWGDTVLEGPYQLNWNAELVVYGVSAYYNSKGDLVAYYVSFGQQAWFTDDCDIDEENDGEDAETIYGHCSPGDIVGHIFVSGDLRYGADDWNNPADFQD